MAEALADAVWLWLIHMFHIRYTRKWFWLRARRAFFLLSNNIQRTKSAVAYKKYSLLFLDIYNGFLGDLNEKNPLCRANDHKTEVGLN